MRQRFRAAVSLLNDASDLGRIFPKEIDHARSLVDRGVDLRRFHGALGGRQPSRLEVVLARLGFVHARLPMYALLSGRL